MAQVLQYKRPSDIFAAWSLQISKALYQTYPISQDLRVKDLKIFNANSLSYILR